MEPVSGEVHVHPVPRLVFQMGDGGGLDEVSLKSPVELAVFVTIREFIEVALVDLVLGHTFLSQHPGILRHSLHEFHISFRFWKKRSRIRLFIEETEQLVFLHRHDLLDAFAALVECVDVLFHGSPRNVHQARDGLRSFPCGIAPQYLFDSWHTDFVIRHNVFRAAIYCGTRSLQVCPMEKAIARQ